jgi:hypothetical protein
MRSTPRTVIVARDGALSVGHQLAEMREWLAERNIVPRELAMQHIVQWLVVYRATFEGDVDAQCFVRKFDVNPQSRGTATGQPDI